MTDAESETKVSSSEIDENKFSIVLTEVNDIPRMLNVYAHKYIPYVEDGVTITSKFHEGLYGDVVVQKDVKPNLRVNSIVFDLQTRKVVYRDHFNIFESRGVRTYVPHLKAKKIDQSSEQLCIYVREGLFASYHKIFTDNFNVDFEIIQPDENSSVKSMKLTFSRSDFDLEADFNKQAFKNACGRHCLESTDTTINWKYPEGHKFCVNCAKDDSHHQRYKAQNKAQQIGFCISWEDLLNGNMNCPACVIGKARDAKKTLVMDILNTEDKNLMCEKILDFLDKYVGGN